MTLDVNVAVEVTVAVTVEVKGFGVFVITLVTERVLKTDCVETTVEVTYCVGVQIDVLK